MLNLKQVTARTMIALLIACLFVYPIQAQAKTAAELQKEKQTLEKKIKDDQAAKKQKQAEQDKLDKQIGELDNQIGGIQDKIQHTKDDIGNTEKDIQGKQDEIAKKEAELKSERDHQAETLRVIYESGQTSGIEMLVSSDSISEVLVYHDYLDALESKIERTIEDVNTIKTNLEKEKSDLENKHKDLAALQDQQHAYSSALDGQKREKDQLLANAKSAEGRLAQAITDAQKVYADVNNELTRLQEAARQRAAQGSQAKIPPGVSGVGFQYPTSFLYISTPFGGQTPFQNFHTGVDFVNYAGTPILAAADGVVTRVASLSYGYGNHVMISHNERFSTVYGHFQGFAPGIHEGETVKRGDVIGYMGTTGWSTGPHLHFEIREYGVPVNPMVYMP